jgi:hypothetical protein
MSSTGQCFDIGSATKQSLDEFIRRQRKFSKSRRIDNNELDYLDDRELLEKFPVYCSMPGVAGNGALMRLAPVPLFFYEHREEAIEFSGYSGQITHGDTKAYDACRYFGALIYAALNGYKKQELLAKDFYENHKRWFGEIGLCNEIVKIAQGSYQRPGGYDDGIRGKGYIVNALEAALWAFWSDDDNFEKGVLAAVNLGDDTDTTAAIYGQLAGAYYGYKNLPMKWVTQIYAKKFILQLSKWIAYEGKNWKETETILPSKEASLSTAGASSVDNLVGDNLLSVPEQQSNPRIFSALRERRRNSDISTSNPIPMDLVPHRHHNPTTTSGAVPKLIDKKQRPPSNQSTPKRERKNKN